MFEVIFCLYKLVENKIKKTAKPDGIHLGFFEAFGDEIIKMVTVV